MSRITCCWGFTGPQGFMVEYKYALTPEQFLLVFFSKLQLSVFCLCQPFEFELNIIFFVIISHTWQEHSHVHLHMKTIKSAPIVPTTSYLMCFANRKRTCELSGFVRMATVARFRTVLQHIRDYFRIYTWIFIKFLTGEDKVKNYTTVSDFIKYLLIKLNINSQKYTSVLALRLASNLFENVLICSTSVMLWWRQEITEKGGLGRQSNYCEMNYVCGFSLKSWWNTVSDVHPNYDWQAALTRISL